MAIVERAATTHVDRYQVILMDGCRFSGVHRCSGGWEWFITVAVAERLCHTPSIL
ncbi:hypothetical protein [Accumulibacter sp.]|uniref:hypothetical protein n=1 Tax=Accumulibacter sp. TaxID=2053492 RepID=UPI002D1604DF|nr:hypothetical protein [Accumulibacter sp.]HPU79288.1 hypothetical protein [Accumulibacter sp.]